MKKILVLILCVFFCKDVYSAEQLYFGDLQGLFFDGVIYNDEYWVGGTGINGIGLSGATGICIYNGEEWNFRKITLSSEFLNPPSIKRMQLSRDGGLWIGTNYGLFKYEKETDEFIHYSETSKDYILGLTTDKYGNLWFISEPNKLTKFDGTEFTVYAEEYPKYRTLGAYRDIYADVNDTIRYAGTDAVIKFYDGVFTELKNTELPFSDDDGGIATMNMLPSGAFIATNYNTANEIIKYKDGEWTKLTGYEQFGVSRLFKSVADNFGNIFWKYGKGLGILMMDKDENFSVFDFPEHGDGFEEHSTSTMTVDGQKNMWFTMGGDGILRFDYGIISSVEMEVDKSSAIPDISIRSVVPNPSFNTTKVTIFCEPGLENQLSINLYDSQGKLVKEIESLTSYDRYMATGTIDINVTDINSGLYYLYIKGGNTGRSIPVVVQKGTR